jgi:hypothetical protein
MIELDTGYNGHIKSNFGRVDLESIVDQNGFAKQKAERAQIMF